MKSKIYRAKENAIEIENHFRLAYYYKHLDIKAFTDIVSFFEKVPDDQEEKVLNHLKTLSRETVIWRTSSIKKFKLALLKFKSL